MRQLLSKRDGYRDVFASIQKMRDLKIRQGPTSGLEEPPRGQGHSWAFTDDKTVKPKCEPGCSAPEKDSFPVTLKHCSSGDKLVANQLSC